MLWSGTKLERIPKRWQPVDWGGQANEPTPLGFIQPVGAPNQALRQLPLARDDGGRGIVGAENVQATLHSPTVSVGLADRQCAQPLRLKQQG